MTKAVLARTVVAAMVLNRLIKKRQLANLLIKNMKQSKSGNHDRGEFDWEKHCRSTFPTPAAFVKFYKLTPNEFDSLRDKIAVYCKTTSLYHPEVKLTPELMLAVTLRMLAGSSYLDVMCIYNIGTATVYSVFEKTVSILDLVFDKLEFPINDEEEP